MKKVELTIIILTLLLTCACSHNQIPLVKDLPYDNGAVSYNNFSTDAETEVTWQTNSNANTNKERKIREPNLETEKKAPKRQAPEQQQQQTAQVSDGKYENLEGRVSNLETKVDENHGRLKKHNNRLNKHAQVINALSKQHSQLKQNFNHSVKVIKNVNNRVGRLEDKDWHQGETLEKFKIRFKAGQTKPEANDLKKLDEFIKKNPDMKPRFIFGATDETGPIEKNRKIAMKRALFVKKYLTVKGIICPGDHVSVQAQIETFKHGYCHQQNRVAVIHYD